jgi:tRNA threonylcarbamoyladenosine biosynthesis protein TsaB
MMELVIDGSFDELSISVFEDREQVYDLFLLSKNTHSKILVNVFDSVFKQLNITIDDINKLYCCIGPGRYTSLRVVLSTIKGMFFNKMEKVHGVSYLDLVASNFQSAFDFRTACKTSPSKVYFADYRFENGFIKRISDVAESDEQSAYDTPLEIASISTSTTKNLFKIPDDYIKPIDLLKLIPRY